MVQDEGYWESKSAWGIEGIKGYYDGYYSSFYKSSVRGDMEKCLDKSLIKDMVASEKILADPLAIFSQILDFKRDINEFKHFSAIFENISKCRFEESFFDILTLCTKNPDQCAPKNLLTNLSKNMFVLVGKMTSLAETFKDFPNSDNDAFREQMKELGQDAGTFVRVIFNFQKKEDDFIPDPPKPVEHHDEPKKEDPKPETPVNTSPVVLLEATYGKTDVSGIIIKHYRDDGWRKFKADAEFYGSRDPSTFHLKWSVNGEVKEFSQEDGAGWDIVLPDGVIEKGEDKKPADDQPKEDPKTPEKKDDDKKPDVNP